jgi:2-octaprenyl-6-methoxyphenol hydroxylase
MTASALADAGGASRAVRVRVVGSGPVSLAFACFARRQGIAAQRIELDRVPGPPAPALASRTLALSLGTWQLLARIALMPRAAPIGTVDVTVSGLPGRVRLTARELGVPALGYVVRYSDLLAALERALDAAGFRDTIASEAQPLAAPPSSPSPSPLVVHAEGDTGASASELAFAQSALLAEVEVEAAGGSPLLPAYERFTVAGPLALLPLPEARRYSLVWCASPEESERRASLSPDALAAELQDAFGWSLGRLSLASTPFVAPMVRRSRRRIAGEREAWIGNAAQALHPVAGQGLNLGVRDAFLLARCLGEAQASGADESTALASYARARRLDRSATIALTDTLARIFSVQPLRPLQSLTLAALDLLPSARSGLARQFMFGFR